MERHHAVFNAEVKSILVRSGVMYWKLAEHLGMSRSTFYKRLQGLHPWKLSEIVSILEFLRRFDPDVSLDRLLGIGARAETPLQEAAQ
jgi:predicted transcriptional regulator